MASSHADRILELLRGGQALDDDEIARALSIEPRQTVNQICRRLARNGVLERVRGLSGKIINRLVAGGAVRAAPPLAAAAPVRGERRFRSGAAERSLVPADLASTLIIIPCSKAKRNGAVAADSDSCGITASLSLELGHELVAARQLVAARASLDESAPAPAWLRYDGSLYRAGRSALQGLLGAGAHVVILSGGYGAVLAREPIGMYEALLKPSWWPQRLLQRVLVAYAVRHGVSSVGDWCRPRVTTTRFSRASTGVPPVSMTRCC